MQRVSDSGAAVLSERVWIFFPGGNRMNAEALSVFVQLSLSPGTVKLIPHKNQYLMSTFYCFFFFSLSFSNMSLDEACV